jgi:hypothetical protein
MCLRQPLRKGERDSRYALRCKGIHVHLKMYGARSKMPASSSSRRMVEARAFVFEIHKARAERNKSNLAAERREF